MGVDSRLIWPAEIEHLVPALDVSDLPRYPIKAALFHPSGGIIRHDAVVWGNARYADCRGEHLHSKAEDAGIRLESGQISMVETTRGTIRTSTVFSAAAGWCSTIAQMISLKLPVVTHHIRICR